MSRGGTTTGTAQGGAHAPLKVHYHRNRTRATLIPCLAAFEVVPADANLVADAHELAEAHRLAWLDALVVEAAIRSRCDKLYSEDLDHGRRFEQLTIVNPFRELA